jgi:predicted DNA-binding antitoxin AbrB/MazE fold protein
MTAIVDGVYENGRIQLREPPANLPEGRVRVIVIANETSKLSPRAMTFGMYPGDTSKLEDLEEAEWHGDTEWDGRNGR